MNMEVVMMTFEQFAWTIVFMAMGARERRQVEQVDGYDGLRSLLHARRQVLYRDTVVLPHDSERSRLDCTTAGQWPPRQSLEPAYFRNGADLFDGDGYTGDRVPQPVCVAQENDLGQVYLTNIDFLENGMPTSVIAMMATSTVVGYVSMRVTGEFK